MIKFLSLITILVNALPELQVRKDIVQQVYSVNVEAQETFFGTNDFFVTQGKGLCRMKSSDRIEVTDSGVDGALRIDLNPGSLYHATVVVECRNNTLVDETNAFLISVLCRDDVPNLYISELLTIGYKVQFFNNYEQCFFRSNYNGDVISTSNACPFVMNANVNAHVFKSKSDLNSNVAVGGSNYLENIDAWDINYNNLHHWGPKSIQLLSFDGNYNTLSGKGANTDITFQYRFTSSGGGEVWTPMLSLRCNSNVNTKSMYPQSESQMIFAVLPKDSGSHILSIHDQVIDKFGYFGRTMYKYRAWRLKPDFNVEDVGNYFPQMSWPTGQVKPPNDKVTIQTNVPFRQIVYIKAWEEVSNWTGRMAFEVTVCGNESIQKTLSQGLKYILQKEDGGIFTIDISSWFKDIYDPSLTHKECFQNPQFKVCIDENCLEEYSKDQITISGSILTISKTKGFYEKELFVQKSIANFKISQNFSVKVCGEETVQAYYPQQSYEIEINSGNIEIPFEKYYDFMTSTDEECPVIRYDIQNNQSVYTGDIVSIVNLNKITIKTYQEFKNEYFYFNAWTESGDRPGFFTIILTVVDCKTQTIDLQGASVDWAFQVKLAEKVTNNIKSNFRSSHEKFCPLISFKIESVSDFFDGSQLKNASKFIFIDDKGILSVTDTSKSLSKQRLKIRASTKYLTSDEFEVILSINKPKNQPPQFVGDIPKIIEINIRNPKNITLPSFVDFNGDDVTFSIIGLDEKIYKIQDKQLQMVSLTSKDVGKKMVIFQITDSNGAQSSKNVELDIIDKEIKIFKGVVVNETNGEYGNEEQYQKKQPKIDQKKQIQAQAKIKNFNQTGNFDIIFEEEMNYPDEFNSSNLQISVIPNDNLGNISDYEHSWTVLKNYSNIVNVQLNFTQPLKISALLVQDELNVTFKEKLFSRTGSIFNQSLITKIPKQLPMNKATKTLMLSFEVSEKLLNGFFFAAIAVNLIQAGAGSLDNMISLINALQIIIHLPILRIIVPANVGFTFRLLLPFVMFDIFDSDFVTEKIIGSQDEQDDVAILDQMKDIGYRSSNSILNLGSIYFFVLLYLLKLILLAILIQTGKLQQLKTKLEKQMLYGEIIFIALEGYFEFLIAGYLSTIIGSNGGEMTISKVLSKITGYISFFSTLFFFPCILVWYITRDIKVYGNGDFKQKWGALYDGVKTQDKYTASFSLVFVVRRILFMLIAFNFYEYTLFQAMSIAFLNLFMIIYTGQIKPRNTRLLNRIEMFNDFMIAFISSHMLFYTDKIDSVEDQYTIGFIMISLIGLMIIVNLMPIINTLFKYFKNVYIKFSNKITKKKSSKKVKFDLEQDKNLENNKVNNNQLKKEEEEEEDEDEEEEKAQVSGIQKKHQTIKNSNSSQLNDNKFAIKQIQYENIKPNQIQAKTTKLPRNKNLRQIQQQQNMQLVQNLIKANQNITNQLKKIRDRNLEEEAKSSTFTEFVKENGLQQAMKYYPHFKQRYTRSIVPPNKQNFKLQAPRQNSIEIIQSPVEFDIEQSKREIQEYMEQIRKIKANVNKINFIQN